MNFFSYMADKYGLTTMEAEVVSLAVDTLTDKQIAKRTGATHLAIQSRLRRSYLKLSVRSRSELILKFRGLRDLTDSGAGPE